MDKALIVAYRIYELQGGTKVEESCASQDASK